MDENSKRDVCVFYHVLAIVLSVEWAYAHALGLQKIEVQSNAAFF